MKRFFVQAEQDSRIALKLQPNSIAPYRVLVDVARNDIDNKLQAPLNEALKKYPASYNLRAIALFDLQPRWGGSIERMAAFAQAAQQYVGQNPRLKVLLGYPDWARGMDMEAAGNDEEAYADFTKALQYGDEIDFLIGRNRSDLFLKRFKDAFADANRIEQLEPSLDSKEYGLKVTTYMARDEAAKHYRAEQFQQAIEIYSILLEQMPDDAEALSWRGVSYCRLTPPQPEPAIADLKHAVDISPESADAIQKLSTCLAVSGRTREAISYEEAYLKLSPDDGAAFYKLGYLYQQAGDRQKAGSYLKKSCSAGFERACTFLKDGAAAKAQCGADKKN